MQVTSDGRWLAEHDATEQITLTPHGSVRLVSRERASPADRGIVPFDVFQGVPAHQLALPAQATADNEERAFLIEVAICAMQELQDESRQREGEERVHLSDVAVSAMRELQDELQLRTQGAYSSAACAVAVPAPVSLSEVEFEEDAFVVIAEFFIAPQWTDDSHMAALTNTLTALTLAGVPVSNTYIDVVLESLRHIVTITAAPAEA